MRAFYSTGRKAEVPGEAITSFRSSRASRILQVVRRRGHQASLFAEKVERLRWRSTRRTGNTAHRHKATPMMRSPSLKLRVPRTSMQGRAATHEHRAKKQNEGGLVTWPPAFLQLGLEAGGWIAASRSYLHAWPIERLNCNGPAGSASTSRQGLGQQASLDRLRIRARPARLSCVPPPMFKQPPGPG